MNKLLIAICLFASSCSQVKKEKANAIQKNDFLLQSATIVCDTVVEKEKFPWEGHELEFSSEVKYSLRNISIDTTSYFIKDSSKVTGFLINPTNNKVLRPYRDEYSKSKYPSIDGYFLGQKKITLLNRINHPTEFKEKYLFFNIWDGGDVEGTITKVKFDITNLETLNTDTLKGGAYSEGAGTWEWIIGYNGKPIGIVYGGDQRYELTSKMLSVTNYRNKRLFLDIINYTKKDTVTSISLPLRSDVYHIRNYNSKIFISSSTEPLCNYLSMFNSKGDLVWQNPTGYLNKLLLDTTNNYIIAHGYYFTKSTVKNSKVSFVICFNILTGDVIWDFPTTDFFDRQYFIPEELFAINSNLYGLILQRRNGLETNINHLLIFNKKGEIVSEFKLDPGDNEFSVISQQKDEFEVVYNTKSVFFKISP